MTTAHTLIGDALGAILSISPGEPISGPDAEKGLRLLNRMLKTWSAKGLMIPYRTLENFSITSGIGSRTIGDTGQLVTVRPDRVTGAYLRDSSGYDTPLDPMTKEEYSAIPLKTATGRPRRYYYDPQFPNGFLNFDYVTDASYTLILESLKPINQFTTLQTEMALPGEYEEPIVYLLVKRLAPDFGFSVTPEIADLITDSENFITRKNATRKVAKFDPALSKPQPFNINEG